MLKLAKTDYSRISHILVPAQPKGKIKNEQMHVGRTSIHDVIVMLKLRLHVASQRTQDFLEGFFMFLQY